MILTARPGKGPRHLLLVDEDGRERFEFILMDIDAPHTRGVMRTQDQIIKQTAATLSRMPLNLDLGDV